MRSFTVLFLAGAQPKQISFAESAFLFFFLSNPSFISPYARSPYSLRSLIPPN